MKHQFLLVFLALNLLILLTRKRSATLVLKFFQFARFLHTPEVKKKNERLLEKCGMPNPYELQPPTREEAEKFLFMTGLINSIGTVFIFILIWITSK
jgi:hypothetical protein